MKLITAVKAISTAALILGLSGLLPAAENPVLLKNGQVITVSGETIPGGDILVQGTKIVMVGRGSLCPPAPKSSTSTAAGSCPGSSIPTLTLPWRET